MTEVCTNHCQIINRRLSEIKVDDEQTFASLAVLAERLERLKKLSKIFSNIEFSKYVKKLESRKNALPVS
jgi:hypothetical protein